MVIVFNNKKTKIKLPKKPLKKKICTIFLFGVLYTLEKINNKLYLKLHFSFNLYIEIPVNIHLYILKKRLIVYGDIKYVKDFILNFMSFRIPNIYTGIGLREKNERYIIKPGKIRKR